MAFGLTIMCVQYKCHISVLVFSIFHYVISKLAFWPFFLTLSDSTLRETLQLLLASLKLFTVLAWSVSVTCQFLPPL